jgi:hypothetical protein
MPAACCKQKDDITMFAGIASALGIAPLLLSLSLPPSTHEVQIGTSLFCNTQQQMERYVAAFHGDEDAAINAVNAEAHDPNACGYRTIAYIRGPEIATARNTTWTFNIVEVLVVAVRTEGGFQSVTPEAFFSVERVDERAA